MKTAIQEMIFNLENQNTKNVYTVSEIIENIKYFMEKEKQQIIEAHAVGRIKEVKGILTDGESYYNETFNF